MSDTNKIDITNLPVGMYADGSVATVNLSSRNLLCQGEPRSGKSVFLAALCCSLLRSDPQPEVAILSPKILDFQNFNGAARLISDYEEMLEYLEWVSDQGQKRKQICLDRHIKKIDESMWDEIPPIVTVVDEYAIVYGSKVAEEGKGRPRSIGLEIDTAISRIVAEMGFAGISSCLTTQRFATSNIDSNLRENISGARISFKTNGPTTDTMLWAEQASDAPCHTITRPQVGCGFIGLDGLKPRAFKGALTSSEDEIAAAKFYMDLKESKGK